MGDKFLAEKSAANVAETGAVSTSADGKSAAPATNPLANTMAYTLSLLLGHDGAHVREAIDIFCRAALEWFQEEKDTNPLLAIRRLADPALRDAASRLAVADLVSLVGEAEVGNMAGMGGGAAAATAPTLQMNMLREAHRIKINQFLVAITTSAAFAKDLAALGLGAALQK